MLLHFLGQHGIVGSSGYRVLMISMQGSEKDPRYRGVSQERPLQGSALPYTQGHLMVVIGFDAVNERVLCMDPAFPTNKETLTSYPLQDFIVAWSRRGFIAYIFEPVLR